MSNKRTYPLFIVDASRQHRRGSETDYVSCTSAELPFIAEASYIKESVYQLQYDETDATTIYTDSQRGLRIRLRIISQLPEKYDRSQLRSLLKRALAELVKRRISTSVDVDNGTDENVVSVVGTLISQVDESLANNPLDVQQRLLKAIFEKIRNDYGTE